MKDCKKIHPLLSDYLDGVLPAGEKGRVEIHLKACADARKELEGLKRLRQFLVALPEPKPPHDLHEKIMAKVQGKPIPLHPHRPFWIFPTGLLTAAAAVAVVLFVQNPGWLGLGSKSRDLNRLQMAEANPTLHNRTFTVASNNVPRAGYAPENPSADGNLMGKTEEKKITLAELPNEKQAHVARAKKALREEADQTTSQPAGEPSTLVLAMNAPAARTSFEGATTEKSGPLQMDQFSAKEETTNLPPASSMGAVAAPAPAAPAPPAEANGQVLSLKAVVAVPTATPITSWSGFINPSTPELQQLVTDADSFQKYWQTFQPGQPQPPVDFTKQAVLVLMDQERPTAGYSIHVASLEDKPDQLVVHYKVDTPAPGAVTAQVLTRPWALQIIPKPTKPVVFQKD